MILHLLRHAKTEKYSLSGKDFDRRLTDKGTKQAEEIRNYLIQENTKECELYVSSAQRTKQTANIVFPDRNKVILNELYLASGIELLHFINKLQIQEDIFLIGHNDGISDLASMLLGIPIQLQTSGYIAINFSLTTSAHISAQTGTILKMFRPEISY